MDIGVAHVAGVCAAASPKACCSVAEEQINSGQLSATSPNSLQEEKPSLLCAWLQAFQEAGGDEEGDEDDEDDDPAGGEADDGDVVRPDCDISIGISKRRRAYLRNILR